MNKRISGLSRNQQERLGLLPDEAQQPVQVISLTPAQYRRIEAEFPINTGPTRPKRSASSSASRQSSRSFARPWFKGSKGFP